MHSDLTGPRTAIVTGGARRIGAAIVSALAADGWHVLIHCRRSRAQAEELAAAAGNAAVVSCDLADPSSVPVVMKAAARLPPLGLLVNNASSYGYDTAASFTAAALDDHFATNVRAPALLSQAFAERASPGVIVNLLDAALAAPSGDYFSYTLSKLALAGVTELTAAAYASKRIRVCGIAPALTLVSGEQSPENFAATHASNALGCGVEPDHVVSALRFVLSVPTLTGQVIVLDGGQRFLRLPRQLHFPEVK